MDRTKFVRILCSIFCLPSFVLVISGCDKPPVNVDPDVEVDQEVDTEVDVEVDTNGD